jgi:hypothetical protein
MVQPKSEVRHKQKKYLALDTPISCAFLDAAGRYWLRGKDGSLSRIKKPPPYATKMYGWMQEANKLKLGEQLSGMPGREHGRLWRALPVLPDGHL